MTPTQIRDLFPSLKRHVWMNAAGSSPVCTPVADAIRANVAETELDGDLNVFGWTGLKERVRSRAAAFLGAQPIELAFVPSTSFGFHVVGAMMKARGVREVLTLESEFPSTTVPLLNQGLRMRAVKQRAEGGYPLEDIAAALVPGVDAIALSLVQFAGGYRVDIDGVAKLARERKVMLAINASQAAGQVPIDFAKLGADFLATNCHKWMMAGYGLALLAVRADVLADPPPIGGWLSVMPNAFFDPFGNSPKTDQGSTFTVDGVQLRREASSLDVLGPWSCLSALNEALTLLEAVTPQAVLAHNISLQQRLRAGLGERGFVMNAPGESAVMSGSCVTFVEAPPAEVVQRLQREARIVATPRGGGVRLATHVYNDVSDVEAVLEAFKKLELRPRS